MAVEPEVTERVNLRQALTHRYSQDAASSPFTPHLLSCLPALGVSPPLFFIEGWLIFSEMPGLKYILPCFKKKKNSLANFFQKCIYLCDLLPYAEMGQSINSEHHRGPLLGHFPPVLKPLF
jgi:hypothetical protein